MRIYRLFTAILALIVIACLTVVQGQTSTPSITHISAPAQTVIVGKTPAILYLGTQQQPMPYSQYLANPNNAIVPSLWIQGTGSWTQYVTVPQGATVPLIVVSPTGGSGYLGEILNGITYNSNFYFYPNSLLTFYADTIGQHTLSPSHKRPAKQPSDNKCCSLRAPQTYLTPYNYPAFRYSTPINYYSGHHIIGGLVGHGIRGFHGRGHHK